MDYFHIAEFDIRYWLDRVVANLRIGGVLAALTLLAALPCHATGMYSGASVGTDGRVYGWGVTNAPGGPMFHMNYATVTLTSPVKHRQAYGGDNARDYIRVDVSLPYDSGDLGTYLVANLSDVFCYSVMNYIIWHWGTQAQATIGRFDVEYSSFIPVDHIDGPTPCFWQEYGPYPLIYMGDAFRGTFRSRELLRIIPDGHSSSGFTQGTGQSRNYGPPSPANGSTLTSADEDGIALDCYKWDNAGQATPGFQYDVSFPYSHQGQVHYSGSSSNPLEPPAPINWDMRTVLNTTNSNAPTAYVNCNHTCYPAHQVKVNGTIVYLYTPPSNDPGYLFDCLFRQLNKVTGQTSPTPVPTQ